MPDHVDVSAGWALWGKPVGTREDYSVRACSHAPFTRADYAKILSHFTPGTATVGQGGPGALPWVTLSHVGIGDDLHLGIGIEERTDDVDGVGRPITRTRYFCVPYQALAGSAVSYYALYQQVAEITLPASDGDLIPLRLPRSDPDALAESLAEFGDEPVAAVAALLLDGPVSIVRSESATLAQRLRYLDAVACLLPYGYRARYAAATWSVSGARHRIRLAFAARPRDDAAEVSWGEMPNLAAIDGAGAAYFREFERLRGRLDRQAERVFLPAELITRLAMATDPQRFEQPEPAVYQLRSIDLPFAVWAALVDGLATPAQVREVFELSRVAELPSDGRLTMLRSLIQYGEPEDLPAIQRSWEVAAAHDPASLAPDLGKACRGLLWTGSPRREVADYLTLAAQHGLTDGVLEVLVAPPRELADLRAGAALAAKLVQTFALAADAADRHPLTRTALVGNPVVACHLLATDASTDRSVTPASRWLDPVLPTLTRVFAAVLAKRPSSVDQRSLAALAQTSDDCLGLLMRAASEADRLDRVLPGFVTWLASSRGMSTGQRVWWRDTILAMTPRQPESQALIDLSLLMLGFAPRFLLAVAGQPSWRNYSGHLTKAWGALVNRQHLDDDQVTAVLAGCLRDERWADNVARETAIVELTRALTRGGARPILIAAVAGGLSIPEAARGRPATEWLGAARRDYPDVIQDGMLTALQALPADSDPGQIARLCALAFREGIPPEQAWQALANSGAVNSVGLAVALLAEMRTRLRAVGAEPSVVFDWGRCFAASFAASDLGRGTGATFREQVPPMACEEIWHQLDLLYAAGGGGARSGLVLSDDVRKKLTLIRNSVDVILKEARRPAPWRMLDRVLGHGGQGGRDGGREEGEGRGAGQGGQAQPGAEGRCGDQVGREQG